MTEPNDLKVVKRDHIIIAPHPDDEIIGCFEILEQYKKQSNKMKLFIIYTGDSIQDRREEALRLKSYFDCTQLFQSSIPPVFLNQYSTIYVPDPFFETHPLHRKYGTLGEELFRKGMNIVFYNTNMTAPYIHEVENSKLKEELLNKIYKSQKKLWMYEKKYVLFEGRCKWIL